MTRKVLTLVADVANANAVAQKIGQGPLAERQPTSSGAVAIPLPTPKTTKLAAAGTAANGKRRRWLQ